MFYENLPRPFILDVVGPTGTGKSDFAQEMALARADHDAEIVCMDSRTIYKGMDIGTAKSDELAQQQVPHHLLDIAEPTERMGLWAFQKAAQTAIQDILLRGKIPILVGGAGVFRHLVLEDPRTSPLSPQLLNASSGELVSTLSQRTPYAPFRTSDRESLTRFLTVYPTRQRSALGVGALSLGIEVVRTVLKERIQKRTGRMLAEGLEQEVRTLVDRYGWSDVLSTTIGYAEFRPYFEGQCSVEEVAKNITASTIRLANRQRIWFGLDPHIHWITNSAIS